MAGPETLHNVDELGKKTAVRAKGPKPLSLKPRDLKPPGPRQTAAGDEPAQAGGGILVDQNGQILWYSAHMNDIYYQFLQTYSGMTAYNKAAPTLNFPVGAAVSRLRGKSCQMERNPRACIPKRPRSLL